MRYLPLIIAVSALVFYLIFSFWPKDLHPKEVLRQKHDFSLEILTCEQNKAIVRILEGNIVEVGGRYKSGEPVMGFKPSAVHMYDRAREVPEEIMKM